MEGPVTMGLISSKLRASAKGQPCTFCIPAICNGNPETTVLAHIPSEWKGAGIKSPDFSAAFACSACHDHFDQRRLSKGDSNFYALRGLQRTQAKWVEMGLLTFPETSARAAKPSKILARRHPLTGEVMS